MKTYTELATHAKVSIAAVSRAYTPGASISAKMLAKISLAAKQLGHPLPPLPLIGLGLPPLEIGVFAGKVPSAWQETLLQGVNRGANNWNVQLHALSAKELVLEPIKSMTKLDGALLLNGTPAICEALQKCQKPWVDCMCLTDQHSHSSIVSIDYIKLGQQLARTLVQRNYQKITCVLAGRDLPMQRLMFRGIAGFLDRSPNISWQQERLANVSAEVVQQWAGDKELGDPDHAYCCLDETLATKIRRTLEVNGKTMPKDGGLLSVSHSRGRLEGMSRIVMPIDDMMSSAVELLRGLMIDVTRRPELRLLVPEFIQGETVQDCE